MKKTVLRIVIISAFMLATILVAAVVVRFHKGPGDAEVTIDADSYITADEMTGHEGTDLSEEQPEPEAEPETPADPEPSADQRSELNPEKSLSIPTCIAKLGDNWFVVDCYHDRIIYSDSLDKPLEQWYVMTDEISRGHTVASDGRVYLVDDTENNRVLVYTYDGYSFDMLIDFDEIGNRPHYIVYNEADSSFYVWSSMTGEMYVFTREGDTDEVYINRVMKLDELDGVYVRSFTIVDDHILLVSGNRQIIEVGIEDFQVVNRYPVPAEISGMIQILPLSEGGYYISISTDEAGDQDYATLIYAENLEDLETGVYTDVYSYFGAKGTPYYLTRIDGRYYMTEHRNEPYGLWSFDVGEDHMPTNISLLH